MLLLPPHPATERMDVHLAAQSTVQAERLEYQGG
jgi:hypothetical protein